VEHSGKMVLLMDIIRHRELIGDKLLVFSHSLLTLKLIEEFLVLENNKEQSSKLVNTNKVDDSFFYSFLAELSDFFYILSLMMAELTDKFCQYFGRLGQKKSCLAIVILIRILLVYFLIQRRV
jgi:hypothetical protein